MRLRNYQIKEVIIGNQDQPGNPGIHGGHVFWPVTPQFICAVLACGVAVGLYFLLRPHMGMETVSWWCMWEQRPLRPLALSNITE